jgi:hypothetical protein
MPYHLKHPEHGEHICYTPEDVEAHKLIGWVPFDEPQQITEPPKKRGRKPKAEE